ncbi:MAG: flagellar protein FlaG [Bdellovibrionota bacterium]
MDIKGVVRNIVPFSVKKKEESKTGSALDTDNEKDANGQQAGEGDQRRRNLSPEEIAEAVKYLSELPGVKDNGLKVRLETKDDVTVVYVEDRDGKIVRRIPESELSLLTAAKEKKSGHLLNRAM